MGDCNTRFYDEGSYLWYGDFNPVDYFRIELNGYYDSVLKHKGIKNADCVLLRIDGAGLQLIFIEGKKNQPFKRKGFKIDISDIAIGKRLIAQCEQFCAENKIEFLTVKTLDESRESESYRKTRLFYLSVGFKPLEVFPLFWDKDNPCLFMAKYISTEQK
ncbi:MAG: hypothetical protein FWF81_00130 [Defluviitaleaceae bacterium]|nr:hypothetical protein [Defluviitaleaceae bacterium]